ncbi:hypothetical protein GXW71_21245 [Roseomonas hellenica]|uniref:Uncharacterized protein n=1 Tax=Plastoroseomonas hellenica TaxID=2687306 RepID=A0ABS5F2Z9_9PROT|nr:hypothetical protein [Plastoroseomonas hellenica]MBR0666901.1 hypothetical protein [Plastoroseomonas hellenica]
MSTVIAWLSIPCLLGLVGSILVLVYLTVKMSLRGDTHWSPIENFGSIHRREVRQAIWRDRDSRRYVKALCVLTVSYLLTEMFNNLSEMFKS